MNPALLYSLAARRGPQLSLAAFMAAQADGFWFDFTRMDTLSQDTAGATPVTAVNDVIGRALDQRTGANSPRNASQATGSFKPRYQLGGALFDATDDRLVTDYLPSASGANFIVAKSIVPASIAMTQFVGGSLATGTGRGFFLGFGTNGQVRYRVGAAATTQAGGNYRGQTVVTGLTCDGTTLRVFAAGQEIVSTTQTGVLDATLGLYVGAVNLDNTLSGTFGGTIESIVVGRQFLDLTTFNQIAAVL